MLQVQKISKTYSNNVKALNNIDLEIAPGIFGLLGPNGAGKSSLMRTLATLQPPDTGSIHLGEIDVLAEPEKGRRHIGYLPQDFGLYPNVSARELLDQFALYKGFDKKTNRRELVDHYLSLVNLHSHADKKLGGYSGGMRQRFGIAQALLGEPRLLIVDEPTAGLDPAERLRLQSLLAQFSEDRVVLLSTHLVEDVLALCPEVAIMNQGQVLCTGQPENLLAQLDNKIWQRTLAVGETVECAAPVISNRIARGKTELRVLSEVNPGADFSLAAPHFDDVYFAVLNGVFPSSASQ